MPGKPARVLAYEPVTAWVTGMGVGQLAMARPQSCTLIVGAPKHVRGTGGPSRVLAMCRK